MARDPGDEGTGRVSAPEGSPAATDAATAAATAAARWQPGEG